MFSCIKYNVQIRGGRQRRFIFSSYNLCKSLPSVPLVARYSSNALVQVGLQSNANVAPVPGDDRG